jgi:DNA-binding protein YbaB
MLGLGNVKNTLKAVNEARQMQKKMKEMSISGSSKSGKVAVTIDGTQAITSLNIDDSLVNTLVKDKMIAEIIEAYNVAQQNAQKDMMKNMDLNSIKEMLGQLG